MDIAIRTNSGAPLITPWSPRGMSNDRYTALAKAQEKKDALAGDVGKAMDSPSFKAQDKTKSMAREKIEQIIKRLNVLKKVFSGNPKQMAMALAQVFKELKAALKEYKGATDSEMGMSDAAAAAVVPPDAAAAVNAPPSDPAQTPGDQTSAETPNDPASDDKPADGTPATDPATTPATPDAPAPANPGLVSYDEVDQAIRKTVGEDGLDFTRQLKGLLNEIEDKIFSTVRIQAKAAHDKPTDDAVKDADDQLKDLRKSIDDMESDIGKGAPTAGMHIDVAA